MARGTFDPNKLYLDTTSIFHQIFAKLHLYEISNVETTLHGHFNAITNTINENVMYLHLFDVWLVRNGTANLL